MNKSLRHIMLLAIASLVFTICMFAQSPKHSLSLYAGKATAVPDTRHFYTSFQTNENPNGIRNFRDISKDQEYSLGLMYQYKLNRWVSFSANLGYALLEQDVRVEIENRFFKVDNLIQIFVDHSNYHLFQIAPQIDFNLVNFRKINVGVNLQAIVNVSFQKNVNNDRGLNLKRSKMEYYSGELYPGLFVSVGPIRLDYNIRTSYDKPRDRAIFYPETLYPDAYDPAKSRLTLRYRLWQK
jgi:hypothetical protein